MKPLNFGRFDPWDQKMKQYCSIPQVFLFVYAFLCHFIYQSEELDHFFKGINRLYVIVILIVRIFCSSFDKISVLVTFYALDLENISFVVKKKLRLGAECSVRAFYCRSTSEPADRLSVLIVL